VEKTKNKKGAVEWNPILTEMGGRNQNCLVKEEKMAAVKEGGRDGLTGAIVVVSVLDYRK
jgi:hypothetical protein